MTMKKAWMCAALFAGLFVVVGCGQKTTENTGGEKKDKVVAKGGDPKVAPPEESGHDWWCVDHGVKEEECSICQKEVFKKLKPDEICPKHPDRAKAQCFICNPELMAKNAAVYKAKYGKEPPEPKENMPEKK
jgi:hypothetical protein